MSYCFTHVPQIHAVLSDACYIMEKNLSPIYSKDKLNTLSTSLLKKEPTQALNPIHLLPAMGPQDNGHDNLYVATGEIKGVQKHPHKTDIETSPLHSRPAATRPRDSCVQAANPELGA